MEKAIFVTDEQAPSLEQGSHIQLSKYSGPLDLLLQLIQKQKMNIADIDICEITSQYLKYLKKFPKPSLEPAGEFIKMAAILMYIKSQSLLPPEEIEEEEEDPNILKEKIQQLLINYQRYQKAGKILYERSLLGRDTWLTGNKQVFKAPPSDKIEINKDKACMLLVKSFSKLSLMKKKKQKHKAPAPLPSLVNRVTALASLFIKNAKLLFSKLIRIQPSRHSTLLTFLSLLELTKLEFIALSQDQVFSDIAIDVRKPVTESDLLLVAREEQNQMSEKLQEVAYENN